MRNIEAKKLRGCLLTEIMKDCPFGILSRGKLVGVVLSVVQYNHLESIKATSRYTPSGIRDSLRGV